jgi:hypothetical protein
MGCVIIAEILIQILALIGILGKEEFRKLLLLLKKLNTKELAVIMIA